MSNSTRNLEKKTDDIILVADIELGLANNDEASNSLPLNHAFCTRSCSNGGGRSVILDGA